jgi:hypothetical protein
VKRCRCCGAEHTLATVHRLFLGWQRFDHVALLLFNCYCGSTLAIELPNPRIRHARTA